MTGSSTFRIGLGLGLGLGQEACVTAPASYGVMPVAALLNGALLIPSGDIFYAVQSPRELDVYLARNS